MTLLVVGISHHNAPLDVRERLAFPGDGQPGACADLASRPGVAEAVLVSTCNRTEIYCRGDDPATLSAWLEGEAGKAGVTVREHLYAHTDEAAVRHAFRVAAGLDSMVLGEPQIPGPGKQTRGTAEKNGPLRATPKRPFPPTFSGAKPVAHQTALRTH